MTVNAHRVEVYQDDGGEYRWKARDRNGRIVAVSGEGYINKSHAMAAADSLFPAAELVTNDE